MRILSFCRLEPRSLHVEKPSTVSTWSINPGDFLGKSMLTKLPLRGFIFEPGGTFPACSLIVLKVARPIKKCCGTFCKSDKDRIWCSIALSELLSNCTTSMTGISYGIDITAQGGWWSDINIGAIGSQTLPRKQLCYQGWSVNPVRRGSVINLASLASISKVDGWLKMTENVYTNVSPHDTEYNWTWTDGLGILLHLTSAVRITNFNIETPWLKWMDHSVQASRVGIVRGQMEEHPEGPQNCLISSPSILRYFEPGIIFYHSILFYNLLNNFRVFVDSARGLFLQYSSCLPQYMKSTGPFMRRSALIFWAPKPRI